jgi:hypothetical protein
MKKKPKTKQEKPKFHRSQTSGNPKVEITHSVHHHRETKGYADFNKILEASTMKEAQRYG